MIRGIYTSASGMITKQREQDMRANNLANLNTTGFKRDMSVEREFRNMNLIRTNDTQQPPAGPTVDRRPAIGTLSTGALLEEVVSDFQTGEMNNTGNPLDLALEGDGFFVVENEDGEVFYTRAGNYTLNQDGEVVTMQGYYLLGENGRIQLDTSEAEEISITPEGTIMVDSEEVDELLVQEFENPAGLEKMGENLFAETEESGEPAVSEGSVVQQGYLEQSNVNAVKEMAGMINALRAYEANQKTLTAHDDALDRAVNDVGRTN